MLRRTRDHGPPGLPASARTFLLAAGLFVSLQVFLRLASRLRQLLLAPRWLGIVKRVSFQPHPGCTLSVYRTTEVVPGPALVFIHGSPAQASVFRRQLPTLQDLGALVAYDRPGYGRSATAPAALDLPSQVNVLVGLLAALRSPSCFLVGHSYGAAVALATAATYPKSVSGAILLGACADPDHPDLEHPWPIQHLAHHPVVARLLPSAIRQCNEELMALQADLQDLAPRLKDVQCPVLCLHGREDLQVPCANVAYLRERFAALGKSGQLETQVVEGYNHFFLWEQPDFVNAQIRRFVEAHRPKVT